MKIFAQQYAQSLFDSVVDKNDQEVKQALHNFVMILGRNRDLNKISEIIDRFKEIWNQAHQELSAELIGARDLGPTAKEAIIDYLKSKTRVKKIDLQEKIDKDLIGGFILRYDSKVVDGSLRNSLSDLKNQISN